MSEMSRRKVLKYTLGVVGTTSLVALTNRFWDSIFPTTVNFDGNQAHPSKGLHIVRFFGGVVLDATEAVLVDVTKAWMMNCIKGDCVPKLFENPPVNENKFYHPAYKLGVSQFNLCKTVDNPTRKFSIKLINDKQQERFESLHRYLVDKKIRAKLMSDEYSHIMTSKTSVDDLFSLDYLEIEEKDKQRHFDKMIEITGVEMFNRWYG